MSTGVLPAGVELPEPGGPTPEELFLLDALREERRRRRAGGQPSAPRRHGRRAVLTMVHDEPLLLPIWLRYYSRFFAPKDIYVLDHDSSDGSTDRDGFVRIPVSHGSVDRIWMVRTMEAHQYDLLDRYDAVLVTDVDEIVAPRPEHGTLGDYIDALDEEFVNCLGYEVIHMVDREPPYDPSRGVLDQRGYWFQNAAYNKPALTAEPCRWEPGFHGRQDGHKHIDPDLVMIHLHRMDYATCLARHRERSSRRWAARDVSEGWGRHNRIVDEAEFARWFFTENTFGELQALAVQPIPSIWTGLF